MRPISDVQMVVSIESEAYCDMGVERLACVGKDDSLRTPASHQARRHNVTARIVKANVADCAAAQDAADAEWYAIDAIARPRRPEGNDFRWLLASNHADLAHGVWTMIAVRCPACGDMIS